MTTNFCCSWEKKKKMKCKYLGGIHKWHWHNLIGKKGGGGGQPKGDYTPVPIGSLNLSNVEPFLKKMWIKVVKHILSSKVSNKWVGQGVLKKY